MQKYLLAAGLLATAMSLSIAKPAVALSFDTGTNTFTVDTSSTADVGQSIKVLFNGFVEETLVSGLTSEALFTVLGIDTTDNRLDLRVDLTNTSSAPITSSRVSILGFDLDPNPNSVTSTGIFNSVTSGNPPQTVVGDVEFCFKGGGGPNCQGGGGAGVTLGNTGAFFPVLSYASLPSSVTFSNFFVRYQDITGTPLGNSGVGVGLVPTPAMLPGLIGMGMAALRKREEESAEADS